MSPRLTVAEEHAGDAAHAVTGFVAGRMAMVVGGDVEVSFRASPRTGRQLTIEDSGEVVELLDHGELIGEARAAHLAMPVPNPVTAQQAQAAAQAFLASAMPTPDCFVCGQRREPGRGLRIYPAPVPGRLLHAAPWIPHAAFADDRHVVRTDYLWAAFDCPSGYAAFLGDPPRGRIADIAVRNLAPVEAEVPHVVTAWPLESGGGRRTSGAAVFLEDGELRAFARVVWLEDGA
ncbi:MAG: hypothetical protein H0V29_11390 [Thermoleophilaceae bacterium]|nr:hypothetical protein [Thermoleophilaceae bacterium]